MTNLPRRVAGRKGNKPPTKKVVAWRQPVPYEQRVSLLTATSLDIPSSSTVNITSSSGNWNWEGITSPYSAPYCHLPPPWYPPPYSHMQPCLLFADLTNHCRNASDQSGFTNISPSFVTHRNAGDQSVANSSNGFVSEKPSESSDTFVEPFVVKRLNGRIKICGGCRGQHLKGVNNELLAPPFDICLCHREPQVLYTLILKLDWSAQRLEMCIIMWTWAVFIRSTQGLVLYMLSAHLKHEVSWPMNTLICWKKQLDLLHRSKFKSYHVLQEIFIDFVVALCAL